MFYQTNFKIFLEHRFGEIKKLDNKLTIKKLREIKYWMKNC